jgi:hypothetical protein
VKRVIGIIVGLLKDRISVDSSPANKRARIKKFIKNNMYPGLSPEPLFIFACINKNFLRTTLIVTKCHGFFIT